MKRPKTPPQIDDAEVDSFVTKFLPRNPKLTAEGRAEVIYKLALDYQPLVERERSPEWTKEFARRARRCAMWRRPPG